MKRDHQSRPAPAAGHLRGGAWGVGAERAWAAALAFFALLLRLVYLLESADNPFRLHLGLDPANYHDWAQTILGGTPFGPEPFFQAPLYPYFLAGIYAILGTDPVRPLYLQALLGAATVYVGARLGARYGGKAGLIAVGLLLALYKPAIFYTGVLLVPVLATLLLALALWFAAPHPWLAGICLGAAGLAHPTVLPGGFVAIAGLALLDGSAAPPLPASGGAGRTGGVRGEGMSRTRRRLPTVIALLGGTLLAILPATVHNLAVSGRVIPMSVNAGINLFIGNGQGANGFYRSPFGMRGEVDPLGIEEASRLAGRQLDPVEASRFWTEMTRDAVAENPGRALARYALKVYVGLSAYETPQIESLDFEKRYSLLLRFPLLPNWILLLSLSAFALALGPRRQLHGVLLAATVLTALFIAIFFVTGRFRLPLHFCLALSAGVGLAALWNGLRTGPRLRRGRIVLAVFAGLAAALVFGPNWLRLGDALTFGQYHYRLGLLAEERGEIAEARAEYAAALEIDPTIPRANINLGILTARGGELDAARRLIERGLRYDPRSARGYFALGQIDEVRGNLEAAATLYARAWEVDPTFPRALEFLAVAAYRLGDAARAESLAYRFIDRFREGHPETRRTAHIVRRIQERRRLGLEVYTTRERAEGDVALALGDLQVAARWFERALEQRPDDRAAMLALARIATQRKDGEALARWRQAFLAAGGPAEALEGLPAGR